MTLVDLYDWYLDGQGNLNRWRRGSQVIPGQPTPPGIPRSPRATVSGTTVTVTWALPLSDGGSPLTAIKVTQEGGATHTLAASATSDTFTVSGSGPWTFDIVASNIVGDSAAAAAVATTAATAYRFPGDPLPLLTGQILLGCTEHDTEGDSVEPLKDYVAPETVTGLRYSALRTYYNGALTNLTPSTGAIAKDWKHHASKGRILVASMAIQQSQTWRAFAADSSGGNYTALHNFIDWCETGADAPNAPLWFVAVHEPQSKADDGSNPGSGMLPSDYADMQQFIRSVMNAYATAKAGSPSAYKWKKFSFGGLQTGEAYSVGTSSYKYVGKFYTATGGATVRPHDWIGGDPYQAPISDKQSNGQAVPIGRTGVPQWNAPSQAMAKWGKANNYPIVWGEFGIRNTDADADVQLQDFWDHVTDGTYDVVAILLFSSAIGNNYTNTSATGRWLLVDNFRPDGTVIPNGNYASKWYSLMRDPKVVRFFDLGYPKPAGA